MKMRKTINENEFLTYNAVIREHMKRIGVKKEDSDLYRKEANRIFAMGGVVSFDSIINQKDKITRAKPLKNSPFGEFITKYYENGKRRSLDSFVLSENGKNYVSNILNEYIKDSFLTNGKIASANAFYKKLQMQMNDDILRIYLENSGIKFEEEDNEKDHSKKIIFRINGRKCTYYENTNLIFNGSKNYSPFFFILEMETDILTPAQKRGEIVGEIFTAYWNYQFGNTVDAWKPDFSKKKIDIDREALKDQIKREILEELQIQKTDNHKDKRFTKSEILNQIQACHAPLNLHKNFKTITRENVEKLTGKKREQLQNAFVYLEKRRLNTAKYRPADGWKFDFAKNNIELLFRLDKRKSAVYNIRHRPLNPVNLGGKEVKEMAVKGQKYSLPFGVDNLDFAFKYIFLCEGIFDSVFLKNCLAYSNWIIPHEMNETIQIFRNAGFRVIHILDNFRAGDKGGIRGLQSIVNRDFMKNGDLVYSWAEYSDCKDLNEIAVKNDLDEISPDIIINNCWNEQDARAAIAEYCSPKFTPKPARTLTEEEYKIIFAEIEKMSYFEDEEDAS